jgi:hypothetical protein
VSEVCCMLHSKLTCFFLEGFHTGVFIAQVVGILTGCHVQGRLLMQQVFTYLCSYKLHLLSQNLY